MPFLLPLIFIGSGASLGAYLKSKTQIENTRLAGEAPLMGLSATQLAYYSALGLGVYWLARKSGAIK